MLKKKLSSKQKEIIFDSVSNVLDDLLDQFYESFSYDQLFEDLGVKGGESIVEEIEDEVNKAYENYFKGMK